jgi:hypothetical protein
MKVTLLPGDFFCTENPMALGKAILFIERLWAKDNEADYSHSGIITDAMGTTLEALWRIKGNDLNAYSGQRVIIGRWKGMNAEAFQKGLDAIKEDIGKIYPLWRLPLFAIPGAAKWISSGKFTVCSELACKFLIGAGFETIGRWQGQDPEDVADMITKWKEIDVVYEGTWPA